MDLKILVATHKEYWMPEDEVYLPLHVGREGKQDLGYVGDNTGENISIKNANYCELTGLYWAWKNLDCEYIGLCHYRRYFGKNGNFLTYIREPKQLIFKKEQFKDLLNKFDIVLPKKLNFRKGNIRKQYIDCHYERDLISAQKIIGELYPEYLENFDIVMSMNEGYFANMFVTKREIFEKYCEWLFSILFELEKVTDISKYDAYQARIYGFLSERLFNVWLNKQNYKIVEVDVLMLEDDTNSKKVICRKLAKYLGI